MFARRRQFAYVRRGDVDGESLAHLLRSGPWAAGALEVVWKFKTKAISGRLHKDPWGGTSWPGQPSVNGEVFTSARRTATSIAEHEGWVAHLEVSSAR